MSAGFDIDDLLEKSGALQHGHFALSSGKHSPHYVQCALLLEETRRARQVGRALAAAVTELAPSLVVSPALGGLLIGYQVAATLEVRFQFTERVGGEMTLRRGFAPRTSDRVVVVEDVVTTGKSTNETIAVVEALGACVVGAASIVDRTGSNSALEVPLVALKRFRLVIHEPAACPLCRDDVPLTRPGSRKTSSQPSASL